jgi:hypothetical protein
MRVFSTFGWIFFSTGEWHWAYLPTVSTSDPVAFEYGGVSWTYWHDEAVVQTCNAAGGCEGDLGWSQECPDEVTPDMWWC